MIKTTSVGRDVEADATPGGSDRSEASDKGKLFLRLFLESERRVFAYILTLLPNRTDADDVLQEVSLVMWDKFDERNPPSDFTAWGCRISYFKVLDFYKRNRRSRVHFSQAMLERVAETAIEQSATLQLDDRQAALEDCLEKLNWRDRELLAHRYVAGSSAESAAAQLNRSVDAVYKSLSRIRQALFDCVTRRLSREDWEARN